MPNKWILDALRKLGLNSALMPRAVRSVQVLMDHRALPVVCFTMLEHAAGSAAPEEVRRGARAIGVAPNRPELTWMPLSSESAELALEAAADGDAPDGPRPGVSVGYEIVGRYLADERSSRSGSDGEVVTPYQAMGWDGAQLQQLLPTPPSAAEVARLALGPDDTLVVSTTESISEATAARLAADVRAAVGDPKRRVLVLGDGLQLAALGPKEAPAATSAAPMDDADPVRAVARQMVDQLLQAPAMVELLQRLVCRPTTGKAKPAFIGVDLATGADRAAIVRATSGD